MPTGGENAAARVGKADAHRVGDGQADLPPRLARVGTEPGRTPALVEHEAEAGTNLGEARNAPLREADVEPVPGTARVGAAEVAAVGLENDLPADHGYRSRDDAPRPGAAQPRAPTVRRPPEESRPAPDPGVAPVERIEPVQG